MDSDEGKLFVGGIPWDTTEEKLNEYFSKYGEVTQTVIMRDKTTGRPRGFGFVVFSDPSVLDRVLQDKHTIGDKVVEAKRALSREEQYSSSRTGNPNAGRTSGGGGNFRTKKIFVGGLPPTLAEDGFRQYFETFGQVTDVVIMYDQNTQRPRGFGFISFDTEDAADRVLFKNFHELNGKLVEVKRALPKDANPGGGGSGGRGGTYQGYGASGANAGAYDSRMDGNKFMQPQTTGGGFPYSGYSAPAYGYGAANSAVGYGGYGSYGVGGYGSTGAGFGAPAAYGNPNALNAGYASGQPATLKNSWSNQTPGYGASGYGAAATWNAPGGGAAVSASMGQSPSGASGYGNQAYGYGNYGGSDGSYPGGYGAAGGRSGSGANSHASGGATGAEQQGTGGGYMGSGYGDANGNSGYPGAAWRSDPAQAAGGYGSGYGSAQSRQTQQQ